MCTPISLETILQDPSLSYFSRPILSALLDDGEWCDEFLFGLPPDQRALVYRAAFLPPTSTAAGAAGVAHEALSLLRGTTEYAHHFTQTDSLSSIEHGTPNFLSHYDSAGARDLAWLCMENMRYEHLLLSELEQ
ncbi:hypothetical protein ADEAN_000156300 [Angomonas deanei]|uniref:Uncharacterized protein n=1 Tax=Angomonas deanei TaxID=59799 RepID=A0A7G2C3F2_9TRYP|nr:hypothetical protein ADEAN_000156300 [Angomonas deanei]